MKSEDIPQSVRLAHCREVGDLIPMRCGYGEGSNEIACEGTPCPIYEYRLVRDDEATVDLIAKTQAQTHGVPDAWASFIPEAQGIVTALTAAQGGETP